MRKPFLVLLTILVFCAFAAFAQNNPSSPPSSASQSAQSSSQAGAQAGEQTIDGCIIKKATTYYIQPSSGSPQKLSESPDVASNEGRHVVVHGSQQSGSAANAGNTNPPSGQPGGSSGEQTFNVTRVETVATNCPASMKGNDTSNPK
jgi:hypothetical protein